MTSSYISSVSSPGVGSGLDVNTLVSQLVAASRAGQDKILATKTTQANAQISAVGKIKSALSGLQASLDAITKSSALKTYAAQSADASVFTATAGSAATAGSYAVEVLAKAVAGKTASTAYASSSTSVGTGTVTITLGSDSFDVTLSGGSDSLSHLVSAINQSGDNPGVNATIVNDVNGAHLLLTSTKTGLANGLSVTSAASSGGAPFITMNAIATADDAHIRVDGFDVYSATNSISTAVEGLTINLVKAQPGTEVLLTSDVDTAAATKAVQDFVAQYNAVMTTIAAQTKADATGNTDGALVGDANMRYLVNKLRTMVGSEVTGTGSQWTLLSQLGINGNTDGTLKIDATKLDNAIKSDVGSVQKFFSESTNGLAVQLSDAIKSNLQTGGSLDSSTDNLNLRLKDITRQRDLLDMRMDQLQARYLAQFTALDTLMATMKTTSSYLSQQLSNLPGFTTEKN